MRGKGWPGPIALVAMALVASWTAASGRVVVAPGTVVQWPGAGVESCGLEGEEWQPLAGSCWYAIDLLRPSGELEVYRWRDGRRESARLEVGEYAYPVQRITLADDSQVNLSEADLRRVRAEQRRVAALWRLRGPARFALPLHPPLERMSEGGRFGHRRFFNDQPRSPHSGADYAATTGTPVLAVGAGRVAMVGDLFFSGKSVFVDHGDGLVSMYFHLSEVGVEEGAQVGRGEVLGRVGQTGRATGPHLHFGVRWRGARVDPALLLGSPAAVTALP